MTSSELALFIEAALADARGEVHLPGDLRDSGNAAALVFIASRLLAPDARPARKSSSMDEANLRERLARIEALFAGATDRRQLFLQVVLPHLAMLPDRPSRLLPGELAYEASVELQEDAACPAVPMLTVSTRSPRERANAPGKPQWKPRVRAARFPRSPRGQDHRVTCRSRREGDAP